MKQLYIFKLGSTYPPTAARLGDFDDWISQELGPVTIEVAVVDAEHGEPLPAHAHCAGVIVTGSHAMVTDDLPWSIAAETWLREALAQDVPIFGICYGHQLLARAAGGRVDYHPRGREIGTAEIFPLPASTADPLFRELPNPFLAHTTHGQSVLELPPGAVHLAANSYERNHAFRLGECAWGVQFHPEFDTTVMQAYIDAQAKKLTAAGHDIGRLSREVRDTPFAAGVLRRFGDYVAAANR